MKIFLLIFILFTSKTIYGNSRYDTIANWQIYYGNKLLTSGNENQYRVPETGSLVLTKERKKLEIFYRYDAVKPERRTITIKNGAKVVFHETQHLKDNHPSLIDTGKLFNQINNGDIIHIYYTDDVTHEKNRLIGKIKITVE
jgi:hypothetical protein